jgi:glutathione S-transferase
MSVFFGSSGRGIVSAGLRRETKQMAALTLYHAAPSRSSIVRWMLEELGEPYDIHLFTLSKGEHRVPDYLAINPMGKVPALRHGDVIVTESAAMHVSCR